MRFGIAVAVAASMAVVVAVVVLEVVVAVVVGWPSRVVYLLEGCYRQGPLDCFVVVAVVVDSSAPILAECA